MFQIQKEITMQILAHLLFIMASGACLASPTDAQPFLDGNNLVPDFSSIQTIGGDSSPSPVCVVENGIMTVVGLYDAVGCVMRPDTYEVAVPVQNTVVFTGASGVASIEMYLNVVDGSRNCTGYIPICVECEDKEDSSETSSGTPELDDSPVEVTCLKNGNIYTVENLSDEVGCVMRPDTWEGVAPDSHTVVFTDVDGAGFASVELYATFGTGDKNCTGYLHQCIECIDISPPSGNSTPPLPPDLPGDAESPPALTTTADTTCLFIGTTYIVSNIPDNVGCVMRPDTYEAVVPAGGQVVFENVVNGIAAIELYERRLNGSRNCDGYINICIECAKDPQDTFHSAEVPQEPPSDGETPPDIPPKVPTCFVMDDMYVVEGIPDHVGCVMRPDTWDHMVPEENRVIFDNVEHPGFASVELYGAVGSGPRNCTEYLHLCVECREL